jgi:uncharacterized membrane protein HdeD (DUF308 family)
MNWRLQTILAGILVALGVFVVFNPVTVATATAGVLPWLLLAAGAIQFVSILFRSRRLIRLIIVPAITGALFTYAGLSMKFGDPTTVGPISLIFVLALVLFGTGAAKLVTAFSARRSKYFNLVVISGLVSVLMGLVVMFNWETISAGLIGVVLGLEIIADAVVMAAMGLRDRDGEAAMESLGLDPKAEAIKAEARREAAAAAATAEAAAIAAETARAAQAAAAAQADADLAAARAAAAKAAEAAAIARAADDAAAAKAAQDAAAAKAADDAAAAKAADDAAAAKAAAEAAAEMQLPLIPPAQDAAPAPQPPAKAAAKPKAAPAPKATPKPKATPAPKATPKPGAAPAKKPPAKPEPL